MIKFLVAALLIASDWITKAISINWSSNGIILNQYCNLIYINNHGMAFGFGSNNNFIFNALLAILSLIIIVKFVKGWIAILTISGALSNIIERLYHGFITDFIDLHYNQLHWPSFNLADIYIFIGLVALIMQSRKTSIF